MATKHLSGLSSRKLEDVLKRQYNSRYIIGMRITTQSMQTIMPVKANQLGAGACNARPL